MRALANESASSALILVLSALSSNESHKFRIFNTEYSLDKKTFEFIASGGTKRIYQLPDGNVMAVPRDNVDIDLWYNNIDQEIAFVTRLRELGLLCQNYQRQTVFIDDQTFDVLVMPSFRKLAQNGQIPLDAKNFHNKDTKNDHIPENLMIFGSKENATSKDFWVNLLEPAIKDIVILVQNEIRVFKDNINFIYSVESKKINLFLYDFSSNSKEPGNYSDNEIHRLIEEILSSLINVTSLHECRLITQDQSANGYVTVLKFAELTKIIVSSLQSEIFKVVKNLVPGQCSKFNRTNSQSKLLCLEGIHKRSHLNREPECFDESNLKDGKYN